MLSTNVFDFLEEIKGRRVVITGASAGIGEQIAYHYCRLGADLLITARTEAKLKKVRPLTEYIAFTLIWN